MSPLRVIDGWALRFCTNIAHTFQLLTGRTNFFIAKLGVLFASVDITLRMAGYFHPFPHHPKSMFDIIIGIIYMPIIISRALKLDEADKHSSNSSEKAAIPGITNASSFLVRILWLVFAIQDTLWVVVEHSRPDYNFIDILLAVSFSYGLLVFYYFIEVEPLRPQKSKIRQWVENLSFGLLRPAPAISER